MGKISTAVTLFQLIGYIDSKGNSSPSVHSPLNSYLTIPAKDIKDLTPNLWYSSIFSHNLLKNKYTVNEMMMRCTVTVQYSYK